VIRIRGNDEAQWNEVINKAIDKTRFADVSTPNPADTEFSVEHGLGTIPIGFIVINQDQAAVTYSSDTAWDADFIYLKCDTALVTMRLLIF